MFAAPLEKDKVNDKYNLEIHPGGFLAPAHIFFLTKRTGFIFDKKISLTSSENFSEVSKLEIIDFKENESIVCKIYHDKKQSDYTIDTLRYAK